MPESHSQAELGRELSQVGFQDQGPSRPGESSHQGAGAQAGLLPGGASEVPGKLGQ